MEVSGSAREEGKRQDFETHFASKTGLLILTGLRHRAFWASCIWKVSSVKTCMIYAGSIFKYFFIIDIYTLL